MEVESLDQIIERFAVRPGYAGVHNPMSLLVLNEKRVKRRQGSRQLPRARNPMNPKVFTTITLPGSSRVSRSWRCSLPCSGRAQEAQRHGRVPQHSDTRAAAY
jgi:hypothetical protein